MEGQWQTISENLAKKTVETNLGSCQESTMIKRRVRAHTQTQTKVQG